MFTKNLVLLAALVGQAFALTINTPASLVECQPASITFSDGTSPYILAVIPGGQVSAAAIATIGDSLTSSPVTWTVNLAAGTSITLKLTDSTGAIAYSSPLTIQAGSSQSCLNTSAATSGLSTGAVTTTISSSGTASAVSSAVSTTSTTSAASSSAAASSASSSASRAASSAGSATSAAGSATSAAGSAVGSATSAAGSAAASATGGSSAAYPNKAIALPAVALAAVGGLAMLL